MTLVNLLSSARRFITGRTAIRLTGSMRSPILPAAVVVWFNAADHPRLASGRVVSAERGVSIQAPDQFTLDLVLDCLTGDMALPSARVLVIRGTNERMESLTGNEVQWYSTTSEHLIPRSLSKTTPSSKS